MVMKAIEKHQFEYVVALSGDGTGTGYVRGLGSILATSSSDYLSQRAIQHLYHDAAILDDMAVAEYGRFGHYVSNIRELADIYEKEIYERLRMQFEKPERGHGSNC